MTRSDLAVSSFTNSAPARGQVTIPQLPVSSWVREADSRSLALPAVRHSSMTRRGLLALARVNAAIRASHA